MVIFLDIDGVLHPIPSGEQGVFCHMSRFEELMRRHPSLDVVISSSWRATYAWEEIVSFFSDDLQARLIGQTPLLTDANRYAEISAWLEHHAYDGSWVALDDAAQEFPPDCKQLCLCNTVVGLDDAAALRLECLITQLRTPPAP